MHQTLGSGDQLFQILAVKHKGLILKHSSVPSFRNEASESIGLVTNLFSTNSNTNINIIPVNDVIPVDNSINDWLILESTNSSLKQHEGL